MLAIADMSAYHILDAKLAQPIACRVAQEVADCDEGEAYPRAIHLSSSVLSKSHCATSCGRIKLNLSLF